jgi:hypothetical protein
MIYIFTTTTLALRTFGKNQNSVCTANASVVCTATHQTLALLQILPSFDKRRNVFFVPAARCYCVTTEQ